MSVNVSFYTEGKKVLDVQALIDLLGVEAVAGVPDHLHTVEVISTPNEVTQLVWRCHATDDWVKKFAPELFYVEKAAFEKHRGYPK